LEDYHLPFGRANSQLRAVKLPGSKQRYWSFIIWQKMTILMEKIVWSPGTREKCFLQGVGPAEIDAYQMELQGGPGGRSEGGLS